MLTAILKRPIVLIFFILPIMMGVIGIAVWVLLKIGFKDPNSILIISTIVSGFAGYHLIARIASQRANWPAETERDRQRQRNQRKAARKA